MTKKELSDFLKPLIEKCCHKILLREGFNWINYKVQTKKIKDFIFDNHIQLSEMSIDSLAIRIISLHMFNFTQPGKPFIRWHEFFSKNYDLAQDKYFKKSKEMWISGNINPYGESEKIYEDTTQFRKVFCEHFNICAIVYDLPRTKQLDSIKDQKIVDEVIKIFKYFYPIVQSKIKENMYYSRLRLPFEFYLRLFVECKFKYVASSKSSYTYVVPKWYLRDSSLQAVLWELSNFLTPIIQNGYSYFVLAGNSNYLPINFLEKLKQKDKPRLDKFIKDKYEEQQKLMKQIKENEKSNSLFYKSYKKITNDPMNIDYWKDPGCEVYIKQSKLRQGSTGN